jgi:hypothetical protein
MPDSELPPYINMRIVDEDGSPSSEFDLYMDQKHQYVEKNLGQNGYVIPKLSTTDVTKITKNNDTMASGTMYVRNDAGLSDDERLVIKINGVLYKIKLDPA